MFYFWIYNYLLLERSIFKKKGQGLPKVIYLVAKYFSFPKLFLSKISSRGISEHFTKEAVNTS